MTRKNLNRFILLAGLLAFGGIVLSSYQSGMNIQNAFDELNQSHFPLLESASGISLNISAARTELFRYLNANEPSPHRVVAHIRNARLDLAWMSRQSLPVEVKRLIVALQNDMDRFAAWLDKAEAARDRDSFESNLAVNRLVSLGTVLSSVSDNLRQVLKNHTIKSANALRQRLLNADAQLVAISLILLLLLICGAVFQSRFLNREVEAKIRELQDRLAELSRSRQALRESEARFRTLVEESPLGISLVGADGRYKYISPAFIAMFGYSLKDIPTGDQWFEKAFPDPGLREKVRNTWLSDIKDADIGQARPRIYPVQSKDGSIKEIHFRPVTLPNYDQLVIYEDITEKSRLERQLRQAQKFEAIGTLAGGVAHDFNNLLMGIQGRVSLMMLKIDNNASFREHLKGIEQYVQSASDLTRQLLGFARGGKYRVEPVDLNELLIHSASMFGRARKEIRIHTNIQKTPIIVEADKRQIEQVLLNMFINAWQAMPEGGDLRISTEIAALDPIFCQQHNATPGQYARLVVADTGVGMDESVRRRVFDPFFTTKEKTRGTGLGLASAYGIVKNHSGVITVYSEVGQGATFHIYLPLSDKKAAQAVLASTRIEKGAGTILIVDDETMILEVGKAMLREIGYNPLAAANGMEAVEMVKNQGQDIDLVILDMIMPDLDGGKTFDLVREIAPSMPVILSSGYSLNKQAGEIMKRGCNGFIQKPFSIYELSRKIKTALDD